MQGSYFWSFFLGFQNQLESTELSSDNVFLPFCLAELENEPIKFNKDWLKNMTFPVSNFVVSNNKLLLHKMIFLFYSFFQQNQILHLLPKLRKTTNQKRHQWLIKLKKNL